MIFINNVMTHKETHSLDWNQYLKRFEDPRFIRILSLRAIGNWLILLSIFFTVKIFYEPVISEVSYFINTNLIQKQYIVADPTKDDSIKPPPQPPPESQFARFFKLNQRETLTPVDSEFSIVVPKIAANARIIPNVNPADEKDYLAQLKLGVAHAAGTYFPGDGGHIFLFAHSTDYVWNISTYNAIFYLLYKLEAGDEINLFYHGRRYVYIVEGSTKVNPDQVEYMTRQTDGELLTLQTCWPPGTTLQRLLVFARRKVT